MSTAAQAILAKWGGGQGSQPDDTANKILQKWGGTAQPQQPSMWGKLTESYNPDVEQFAQKHPVLGAPARFFDAVGGAVLGTPQALYRTAFPEKGAQESPEDKNFDAYEQAHPFVGHLARPFYQIGGMFVNPASEEAARYWTGRDPNLKPSASGAASVLPEAFGTGVGNVAAGEMTGEAIRGGVSRVLPKARSVVEAARTTPEQVAEQAKGGLTASTAARQGAIRESLATARKNVSPLYDSIHSADEAQNPSGAIDLSGVIEENPELAPKAPKAAKLTAKEISDAGLAAKQANKFIANGSTDAETRQVLKGLGYAPKVVDRAMQDIAAPGEGGGYTIENARSLRAKIGRAARAAERAGNYQDAARLNGAYEDVTQAMRDRAASLDPNGGLLNDFDRADAKWAQVRNAQKVLEPLLEAKEGRTPSAEEFQSAWNKLTSAQRTELGDLAKGAGLDLEDLKSQSATAGKVLKGTKPSPSNWMQRYMYGSIPMRLGIAAGMGLGGYGLLRNHPELRPLMYALPMAGYVGAGLAAPVMERAGAIEAMRELPEAASRESYGPEMLPKARSGAEIPTRKAEEELPRRGKKPQSKSHRGDNE